MLNDQYSSDELIGMMSIGDIVEADGEITESSYDMYEISNLKEPLKAQSTFDETSWDNFKDAIQETSYRKPVEMNFEQFVEAAYIINELLRDMGDVKFSGRGIEITLQNETIHFDGTNTTIVNGYKNPILQSFDLYKYITRLQTFAFGSYLYDDILPKFGELQSDTQDHIWRLSKEQDCSPIDMLAKINELNIPPKKVSQSLNVSESIVKTIRDENLEKIVNSAITDGKQEYKLYKKSL